MVVSQCGSPDSNAKVFETTVALRTNERKLPGGVQDRVEEQNLSSTHFMPVVGDAGTFRRDRQFHHSCASLLVGGEAFNPYTDRGDATKSEQPGDKASRGPRRRRWKYKRQPRAGLKRRQLYE
ncbi:hypothetical protein MRX96_042277 [Rhipicephalus microplus]